MVSPKDLEINCIKTESKIKDFIALNIEKAGLKGTVVSVSGGIDSAVTLHVTVSALGPEKVTVITMPERDVTPERDIMDVMQHCEDLGVTCNTVEITPILRVIRDTLPMYDITDKISSGNIRARVRMMVAYNYANKQRRMVMGTSNKTELLTGFFTKYGDGGVDLMPLADLYKTQLRQLARYLEIPENIIKKPPSPGFYPGHTDEAELGIDYATLDLILYSLSEGTETQKIAEDLNIQQSLVDSVIRRVAANEHKRRLPLILRLS
ncbi:NAD+ synthase [Candidatus Bathyarchaeota archaeon]|nr:NAD+ synthase [Candidatus Bathyarchaeota archaeon]